MSLPSWVDLSSWAAAQDSLLKLRLFRQVRHHTLASRQRLNTLMELGRAIDRNAVHGAIVECGVYRGGSAAILASATRQSRDIYLFDSFEGLPPPGEKDGALATQHYREGWCAARPEDVAALFSRLGIPQSRVHIVKGWFADTLKSVTVPEIALLHIDADWYDPVKLCLEFFYEAVRPGGFIVLDDYGRWEGSTRAADEFLEARELGALLDPRLPMDIFFRNQARRRDRTMNPLYLLVGIDTEGDNQWDPAARANQTFENIYALPALHALFARALVRPTYFITYPVARDARSADVLRSLLAGRDCEIGAHHHAWETPPCEPDDVKRHAYALSLSNEQFGQQLAHLSSAIAASVGTRPVSYRSGRFGSRCLARVGTRAGRLPHRVDGCPALQRSAQGRTGLRRRRVASLLSRLRRRAASGVERRTGSSGLCGAQPSAARVGRGCIRPRTSAILHQTGPAGLGIVRMQWLRPSVLLTRRHEIAGATDSECRRSSAQPDLPFERSHHRR